MSENYDNEALIELCNQIDLLEYASESMEFEKIGSDSYATHCPLHIDKTSSLLITPSKNLFHCFSCGCGGNIINWIMTFENIPFKEAVNKVGLLTGTDIKNLRQCNALNLFKNIKKMLNDNSPQTINREILDKNDIEKYSDIIPEEWENEGISPDVMKLFNIKVDERANRIVYPVYDNSLNLIGFKGRTRYVNYKELHIQKYMNYTKIGTTNFFIGMKEQKDNIIKEQKVIIFEGIKSVMLAYSWGYNYSLASETSYLNEEQIKILIKMGIKDVTIAYDSDVKIDKIIECTSTLRKFTNVYVIRDRGLLKNKLLGVKEAPVDRGKEVFEILLKERRKL